MITAYGTVKAAVEAMAEGAYDFIEKPFEPALVEQCIKRALERSNLSRENEVFRQQQPSLQLVASDEIMQPVIKVAKKAAASQSTVLLLGESGTGKEVFARQIAAWSTRARGPWAMRWRPSLPAWPSCWRSCTSPDGSSTTTGNPSRWWKWCFPPAHCKGVPPGDPRP